MILTISELFYSIQGEGRFAGVPSYFIRLTGCNLNCGCGRNAGRGSWTCDTYEVWKKGERMPFEKILMDLALIRYETQIGFMAPPEWDINKGINEFCHHLKEDKPHLIITGGEPLLQQMQIGEFIQFIDKQGPRNVWGKKAFFEVETNGTIVPDSFLKTKVDQWNVSPKLSNSGEDPGKFFNDAALAWFVANGVADFKFVISAYTDWEEIERVYLGRWPAMRDRIFLMPACENQEELQKNLFIVADLAKRNSVRVSPRLQISIWNMTTGV